MTGLWLVRGKISAGKNGPTLWLKSALRVGVELLCVRPVGSWARRLVRGGLLRR